MRKVRRVREGSTLQLEDPDRAWIGDIAFVDELKREVYLSCKNEGMVRLQE